MTLQEKLRAGVLGHAVGDALGVPVEFSHREQLHQQPVIGMRSYGTYDVPAGSWSDDTSMTLAAVESLSRRGVIDYGDLMNNYRRWLEEAEFTPEHRVFDVGRATQRALLRYQQGTEPLDCGGRQERDNGNGSLMRMLPFVFYLYVQQDARLAADESLRTIRALSSLTHAHPISCMACGIYTLLAGELLQEHEPREALKLAMQQAEEAYAHWPEYQQARIAYDRLFSPGFTEVLDSRIKSSGYVVDTLEAAIWSLCTTHSYKSCVLRAVNLGEDTDTAAAIAGGLAGIFYGMEAIPGEWLQTLLRREYMEELCEGFYQRIKKSALA